MTAVRDDLAACEDEPIETPGAIQPHGVLLAMRWSDGRVVAASANLGALLGRPAEAALDAPLGDLLEASSLERVMPLLARGEGAGTGPAPIRFPAAAAPWPALLHRQGGLAVLEAEAPAEAAPGDVFGTVAAAIARMQAIRDPAALCGQAVREVRALTGFDRVKLYRFDPDWSGEVVAEDRAEAMPSYLGLHFPASDIPARARELYRRSPDRIIPDARYRPVPLLASAALGGAPLDLSMAQLRSVSPVHLDYLANMGVGASMSVSVLRDGALWGLIACHHRRPHRVPPELRQACRLLAQILAWEVASAEEQGTLREVAEWRRVQAAILEDTARGVPHLQALRDHAADLLLRMGAGGFALVLPEQVVTAGATPAEPALRDLAGWLAAGSGAAPFATDRLGLLHPPAAPLAGVASGLLAVPLSRPPRSFLMWFRPEAALTVTWGGDPRQGPVPAVERLTPRRSFAAWREAVRGRALPWAPHEVAAAGQLRDLVLEVLVRRAEELEAMNSRLARSNEELESFAYVAAHDIREPLRQIETFATLVERSAAAAGPVRGDLGRWVAGIGASSRRLRRLIDDLAAYARLGQQGAPPAPTGLDRVLAEALHDLGGAIAESGAVVELPAAPGLALCDPGQARQVLQNLLSNAIKYRHPDRPPRIRVSVAPLRQGDRAMLRIAVADNGIGFEPRHARRIFEPFQRLHGADRYPGSGIGLAICRRVVARHGGEIGAESVPGEGATFWFTLPDAAGPPA